LPGPRFTVYFFKLFICGGPEMAPALPQSADNRSGAAIALPPSGDNRSGVAIA